MAVSTDPALRALRKTLGNSKYRQLVAEAHKRGFQVKSFASGGPEALMARTQDSLKKEAGAAAGAAYKPAETQLTTALAREDAIQSKRSRDLNDFNRWAIEQQSRFQQAAMNAQGVLLQQNQEILGLQGAAAAAAKSALDTQLQGTGLMPQGVHPAEAATQASFAQQAGAGAQRAAGVIGQGIQSSAQQQHVTAATLAGIQSEHSTKGAERRQTIVDQISELAAKKAATESEYLSGLTKGEQEKALTLYQTEAAAEIAGKKLSSAEARDAAAREFKASESAKERGNKRFLERIKAQDRAATRDLQSQMSEDSFVGRYGVSKAVYKKWTPQQRVAWNRKWATGKAGSDKDPLRLAPTEGRALVDKIQGGARYIDRYARAKKAKDPNWSVKDLRASEIRDMLDLEGVPDSAQDYVVNMLRGSKKPGSLSTGMRKKLERILGGHATIPDNWLGR